MNEPKLTPMMERIIEIAAMDAKHLGDNYVAVAHFLVAMGKEGTSVGALMLQDGGITLEKLKKLTEKP